MQPEQTLPASCRLRVLLHGPLAVYKRASDESWVPVKWGQGKMTKAVFRRLLTAPGRRLSRCELVDDLWSEHEEVADSTSIYTIISLIRTAIGKDLITTYETGYEVAGQELVWVDLDAAEMLLRSVENQDSTSLVALPLLEEALSYLERGAYLEGETGKWRYSFQTKSEELLKRCRFWLAENYEGQNKLLQAGLQYRALLQTLPPDERALKRWMTMLVQHGEKAEALKCYQHIKASAESQGFELSPALEQAVISLSNSADRALLSPKPILANRIEEEQGSDENDDFMDYTRRQISVQGAKIALGLASVSPLSVHLLSKRLLVALTQQQTSDVEVVQYLQQRVEHYWEQRQTARLGPILIPYVTEDLQRVSGFLEGSLLPTIRIQLSAVAGNLAMLLGELFFELNLYPESRNYYKIAAVAAHETNNSPLEAVVYGRRSLTWIYQNQLKAALSCVRHGRYLATNDNHITIWLAAIEAEIQAKMGNHSACLASLKSAAQLRDLAEQKTFYWVHFDVSLLSGYEGVCFLKLGMPSEAHSALTQALMALDTTTNRRKPRLLIDLARSYVQQGEIEAACKSSIQAAELLQSIQSPVTFKRLQALRGELDLWQESASVQQLDEKLSQLAEMGARNP